MVVKKIKIVNEWDMYKVYLKEINSILSQYKEINKYKKRIEESTLDKLLNLTGAMEIEVNIEDKDGLVNHLIDIYSILVDGKNSKEINKIKEEELPDKIEKLYESVKPLKFEKMPSLAKKLYEFTEYMKKANST